MSSELTEGLQSTRPPLSSQLPHACPAQGRHDGGCSFRRLVRFLLGRSRSGRCFGRAVHVSDRLWGDHRIGLVRFGFGFGRFSGGLLARCFRFSRCFCSGGFVRCGGFGCRFGSGFLGSGFGHGLGSFSFGSRFGCGRSFVRSGGFLGSNVDGGVFGRGFPVRRPPPSLLPPFRPRLLLRRPPPQQVLRLPLRRRLPRRQLPRTATRTQPPRPLRLRQPLPRPRTPEQARRAPFRRPRWHRAELSRLRRRQVRTTTAALR
jgi:hypothetical protein